MWAKGMFNTAMKKVVVAGSLLYQGLGWYGPMGLDHQTSLVQRCAACHPNTDWQPTSPRPSSFTPLLECQGNPSTRPSVSDAQKLSLHKLLKFSKAGDPLKVSFITLVSGPSSQVWMPALCTTPSLKFADRWIPEDILAQSPTLRNFTENPRQSSLTTVSSEPPR